MNLSMLYRLEIEGISNTIAEYAVDNFISGYSKLMPKLEYPKDIDLIREIVKKLSIWYQDNITDIRKSKFIINKEEHEKAYKLILEFRDQLNKGTAD